MTPTAEELIGVLAVDDHAIFLDVAREVVTSTPGFCWVGGARSGEEGLRAVEALSPDLVLLDMRMPGMDGLEAAHRITAGHPGVVVVLVLLQAQRGQLREEATGQTGVDQQLQAGAGRGGREELPQLLLQEAQALGDLDKQDVADVVAQAVVDELEAVQVQQQQGHPAARPAAGAAAAS